MLSCRRPSKSDVSSSAFFSLRSCPSARVTNVDFKNADLVRIFWVDADAVLQAARLGVGFGVGLRAGESREEAVRLAGRGDQLNSQTGVSQAANRFKAKP